VVAAIDTAAARHRLFHWHLEFPDIFRVPDHGPANTPTGWTGGFTTVLGNPPWLSYSGRQAVQIGARRLELLSVVSGVPTRWPSAHGFFLAAVRHYVSPLGQAAYLLPFPVALLDGYEPVREAVLSSGFDLSVLDQGDNAFPGVSQRTGIFVLSKSRGHGELRVSTSSASVSPLGAWVRPRGTSGGGPAEGELLELLSALPKFPRSSFADPGVHTGNVSKKIVIDDPRSLSGAELRPVREGKDLAPFQCLPPRRWLAIALPLEPGEYCRIGSEKAYHSVPILLRQTANTPIAALHTAPTYFRNSVLACMGCSDIPDGAMVAILNSGLVRFWYGRKVLDSSQRTFPQVKVGALRGLPAPALDRTHLMPIVRRLDSLVRSFSDCGDGASVHEMTTLDDLVLDLYDIPSFLRSLLPDHPSNVAEMAAS